MNNSRLSIVGIGSVEWGPCSGGSHVMITMEVGLFQIDQLPSRETERSPVMISVSRHKDWGWTCLLFDLDLTNLLDY